MPTSNHPDAVAAWAYDAVYSLARAGASRIPGSVALTIELPHSIVYGNPAGVSCSVALAKAILLREGIIEGPHALADVCIRAGERPGVFIVLQPFRMAA